MTIEITPQLVDEALATRFDSDAGDNMSLRQWLVDLARQVWLQGEGFSGKRPWGNSGWDYDAAVALINAGVISGALDEDGYVDEMNDDDFRTLIKAALNRIAEEPAS